MSSSGRRPPRKKTPPTAARGGPGNFAGSDYQVAVAVGVGLRLISIELGAPETGAFLQLEPRSHPPNEPSSFDVLRSHPDTRIEVKLAPKRSDVMEFARTIAASWGANHGHFELVTSAGGTPASDLQRAIQLATEAKSATELDELANEEASSVRELVAEFGPERHRLLRHTAVRRLPGDHCDDMNLQLAGAMIGTTRSQPLVDAVSRRLIDGAKQRSRFRIAELIEQLRGEGFALDAPPHWVVADDEQQSMAVACVLQACPLPLSVAVVRRIFGWSEAEVGAQLASALRSGVIQNRDDATLALRSTATPYRHPQEVVLVARAARALLELVVLKDVAALHLPQLLNLCALARRCTSTDPELAAGLFPQADKALKATGDLHLVFDAAHLSLTASRRKGRSDQSVRDEVQTLICGISWVQQRTGRLPDARLNAEESLRRGLELSWDRNSAFCRKCLGRLYRLEAELAEGQERTALLQQSANSLRAALDDFSALEGFGPTHADAGDCHSLLGRTQLVAGDIRAAAESAGRARDILEHHPATKEYLDLVLLEADLSVTRGDAESAIALASEVHSRATERNAETSEIVARALLLRARMLKRQKQTKAASADLHQASEKYSAIGQPDRAAEARWESLQLVGRVPPELVAAVVNERATVRVEAFDLHERRLADRKGVALAARSGLGGVYVAQLLSEARAAAQRREVDWS